MKLTPALVLGAATLAAAQAQGDQKVLGGSGSGRTKQPERVTDAEDWMAKVFGGMTADARAVWDEVASLVPDAFASFKKTAMPPPPKRHNRKPNSAWDHVVRGADVQSVWVETAGEAGKHRKVGGRLEDYNLRAKKVDPSKLGVDKVKQYSGYLDDEANDKHLFYCKFFECAPQAESMIYVTPNADRPRQGSSSRATTPRTTPSCYGSTAARAVRH